MSDEHPNVELIKRGFSAFLQGDLSVLDALIDDDVLWHQPGHHSIAGDFKGKGSLLGLFVRIWEETEGTVQTKILDVWADEERAVVLAHTTAQRLGKHQDNIVVHVLRLTPEGKLVERWGLADDQESIDRFWA
jgi:ketosteroid isomerase-like protein